MLTSGAHKSFRFHNFLSAYLPVVFFCYFWWIFQVLFFLALKRIGKAHGFLVFVHAKFFSYKIFFLDYKKFCM